MEWKAEREDELLILLALLLGSIALTAMFWFYAAKEDSESAFWLGIITFLGAFILAVSMICIGLSRTVGRSTCSNWSKQTNVPTKFVLLNWADTGTCLAKTPDGHWVQNSNWNAYVGVNK